MTDKEIKGRIKNINDTVKITRAMQMIATTKIYACQKRRDNAAAYMEDAKKTARVAMRFMPATHPLFQLSNVQKHAYVVIAGDKGLCGDYNAQMLSFAEKQFVLGETRPKIYVIGYVVKEYFKGKNCSLIGTYVHSQLEPSVTDAVKLADDLLKGFEKGDFADVSIIYAEVKERGETTPAVMKLLPMTYAPAAESDRVLGACNGENILREMLICTLFWAISSSALAVNYRRAAAMRQATINGENMLDDLRIQYNRSRQDKITNELNDAVATTFGKQR